VIQQGESLVYVKDQMGHASIQITIDVYGHLVPGGNRAAVDRLDDLQESVAHTRLGAAEAISLIVQLVR
jgi:integrase